MWVVDVASSRRLSLPFANCIPTITDSSLNQRLYLSTVTLSSNNQWWICNVDSQPDYLSTEHKKFTNSTISKFSFCSTENTAEYVKKDWLCFPGLCDRSENGKDKNFLWEVRNHPRGTAYEHGHPPTGTKCTSGYRKMETLHDWDTRVSIYDDRITVLLRGIPRWMSFWCGHLTIYLVGQYPTMWWFWDPNLRLPGGGVSKRSKKHKRIIVYLLLLLFEPFGYSPTW